MKSKILILSLVLLFTACVSEEVPEENEDVTVGWNTYEDGEIRFLYPETWEQEGSRLVEGENAKMDINQSEVFGMRCAVPVRQKPYVSKNEKEFRYSIIKPGYPGEKPWEAQEGEPCFEYLNSTSSERSAELDLRTDNGLYLSRLFYFYDASEEEEALKEFESILDTIEIKQ